MKKKNNRTTTILAFGAFDLLHPGHIAYLSYAKTKGDILVVIIARDSSIQKRKGMPPLFSEKDRQRMVAALAMVDAAVLGNTKDHYRSIQRVRPDIVCLGYDHTVSADDIRRAAKRMNIPIPKIIRAKAYKAKSYKSSLLKKKINH